MANTLTNLSNELHIALDTVSRELTGFIPAVRKDTSAEMKAKDDTIRFPIVPAMTAGNIAPAATGPDPSAQTIGNSTMTLSNARSVTFFWEGEEQLSLGQSGTYNTILVDQFSQAMRTIANEVEEDLAELYVNASRAYGTAGTTPFGTANQLDDLSYAIEILEKNGAPSSNLKAVLDLKAIANLRGYQGVIHNVNESGTSAGLRQGAIGELFGAMIHKSGQVQKHTKGTGANYDTDTGSTYALGSTTIHVDTGTGTAVAGDCLMFSGDTAQKYVVKTGFAGDGDMDVVLQDPGLVYTTVADGEDVTYAADYRANMVFDQNAIVLAARQPAMPAGGDAADDVMALTDPASGLTFQVAMYRQHRRIAYEVGLVWGVKVVKPEHIALLIG